MSLIKWRKWSVVMASLVMSFVLALVGEIPGGWVTIVTVVVPAFAATNAFVHWKNGQNSDQ